jgi:hypothetical protein
LVGDTRREWQRKAKIVPLKIRSVETEKVFIDPVEEIALGNFSIVGVTAASATVSDAKVPPHEEPEKLEIDFHLVQNLAILSTRENTLVLADFDDEEITLPSDTKLVGVVPAPSGTFHVSAYDDATLENFKLGYHVNGTPSPNWVALALARREATLNERRRVQHEKDEKRRLAAEHAEQEAATAQKRQAEAKPVPVFETTDYEVTVRLREAYRPALIHVKKSGGKYLVEDVERHGQAIAVAVQAERAELRKQNADPDRVFAKRREERAEALAAR